MSINKFIIKGLFFQAAKVWIEFWTAKIVIKKTADLNAGSLKLPFGNSLLTDTTRSPGILP